MKKQAKDKVTPQYDIIETESGGFEMSRAMKSRLLQMQLNTAMAGSTEMLKWLGKQYLGQSDKSEANEYDNKPLPFID